MRLWFCGLNNPLFPTPPFWSSRSFITTGLLEGKQLFSPHYILHEEISLSKKGRRERWTIYSPDSSFLEHIFDSRKPQHVIISWKDLRVTQRNVHRQEDKERTRGKSSSLCHYKNRRQKQRYVNHKQIAVVGIVKAKLPHLHLPLLSGQRYKM